MCPIEQKSSLTPFVSLLKHAHERIGDLGKWWAKKDFKDEARLNRLSSAMGYLDKYFAATNPDTGDKNKLMAKEWGQVTGQLQGFLDKFGEGKELVTVQCECNCSYDMQVRKTLLGLGAHSKTIYACMDFGHVSGYTPKDLASKLIHELTHAWNITEDHAYYNRVGDYWSKSSNDWEGTRIKDGDLPYSDLLKNAASYEYLLKEYYDEAMSAGKK